MILLSTLAIRINASSYTLKSWTSGSVTYCDYFFINNASHYFNNLWVLAFSDTMTIDDNCTYANLGVLLYPQNITNVKWSKYIFNATFTPLHIVSFNGIAAAPLNTSQPWQIQACLFVFRVHAFGSNSTAAGGICSILQNNNLTIWNSQIEMVVNKSSLYGYNSMNAIASTIVQSSITLLNCTITTKLLSQSNYSGALGQVSQQSNISSTNCVFIQVMQAYCNASGSMCAIQQNSIINITNCTADSSFSTAVNVIGGFIGVSNNSQLIITYSQSIGNITSQLSGGFIGNVTYIIWPNSHVDIQLNYDVSNIAINSTMYAGGFIGYACATIVSSNCQFNGNITSQNTGAFIAIIEYQANIQVLQYSSYGQVSCTSYCSGFIGLFYGSGSATISNSIISLIWNGITFNAVENTLVANGSNTATLNVNEVTYTWNNTNFGQLWCDSFVNGMKVVNTNNNINCLWYNVPNIRLYELQTIQITINGISLVSYYGYTQNIASNISLQNISVNLIGFQNQVSIFSQGLNVSNSNITGNISIYQSGVSVNPCVNCSYGCGCNVSCNCTNQGCKSCCNTQCCYNCSQYWGVPCPYPNMNTLGATTPCGSKTSSCCNFPYFAQNNAYGILLAYPGNNTLIYNCYIYVNVSLNLTTTLDKFGLIGVLGNASNIVMNGVSLNITVNTSWICYNSTYNTTYIGSIVGLLNQSSLTISNCIMNSTVLSGLNMFGSLCFSQNSSVVFSMSTINGSVTSLNYTGGLIGQSVMSNITISQCNFNSNLTATQGFVGQVVGFQNKSQINITFSTIYGNTTCSGIASGGLIGLSIAGTININSITVYFQANNAYGVVNGTILGYMENTSICVNKIYYNSTIAFSALGNSTNSSLFVNGIQSSQTQATQCYSYDENIYTQSNINFHWIYDIPICNTFYANLNIFDSENLNQFNFNFFKSQVVFTNLQINGNISIQNRRKDNLSYISLVQQNAQNIQNVSINVNFTLSVNVWSSIGWISASPQSNTFIDNISVSGYANILSNCYFGTIFGVVTSQSNIYVQSVNISASVVAQQFSSLLICNVQNLSELFITNITVNGTINGTSYVAAVMCIYQSQIEVQVQFLTVNATIYCENYSSLGISVLNTSTLRIVTSTFSGSIVGSYYISGMFSLVNQVTNFQILNITCSVILNASEFAGFISILNCSSITIINNSITLTLDGSQYIGGVIGNTNSSCNVLVQLNTIIVTVQALQNYGCIYGQLLNSNSSISSNIINCTTNSKQQFDCAVQFSRNAFVIKMNNTCLTTTSYTLCQITRFNEYWVQIQQMNILEAYAFDSPSSTTCTQLSVINMSITDDNTAQFGAGIFNEVIGAKNLIVSGNLTVNSQYKQILPNQFYNYSTMIGIYQGAAQIINLDNCSQSVYIGVAGNCYQHVGGFAGCLLYQSSKVKNCTLNDNIVVNTSINGSLVGGLFGSVELQAQIALTNISLFSNLTSNQCLGFICGDCELSVFNLFNSSVTSIYSNSSSLQIGSVIGYTNVSQIILNQSTITSLSNITSFSQVGAIGFASQSNVTIDNISLYQQIISQQSAGGAIGYSISSNVSVILTTSWVTINSSINTGGFIGQSSNSYIYLNTSQFIGVLAGIQNLGGVIGLSVLDLSIIIQNVTLNGYIYGSNTSGCVAGFVDSTYQVSVNNTTLSVNVVQQFDTNQCLFGSIIKSTTIAFNNTCNVENNPQTLCNINAYQSLYNQIQNTNYLGYFVFFGPTLCQQINLQNILIQQDYTTQFEIGMFQALPLYTMQNLQVLGNVTIFSQNQQNIQDTSYASFGIIFGYTSNPTILNISVNTNIQANVSYYFSVSAIIGLVYNQNISVNSFCLIRNCSYQGIFTDQSFQATCSVGGIIGSVFSFNTITIYNSTLLGSLQSFFRVGSIIGTMKDKVYATVSYCYFNGSISYAPGNKITGGIVAYIQNSGSITLSTCILTGTVICNNNCSSVIGVVQQTASISILNTTSTSKITGLVNIGGYVGLITNTSLIIQNSSSQQSISAYNCTASVLGYISNSSIISISILTINSAIQTFYTNNSGGIFGVMDMGSTVQVFNVSISCIINNNSQSTQQQYGYRTGSVTQKQNVSLSNFNILCNVQLLQEQYFVVNGFEIDYSYAFAQQSNCSNINFNNITVQDDYASSDVYQFLSVGLFVNVSQFINIVLTGSITLNTTNKININALPSSTYAYYYNLVESCVGSLIGISFNLSIQNCSSSTNVLSYTSNFQQSGGFVGAVLANNNSISNCTYSGDIFGSHQIIGSYCGGFVGMQSIGTQVYIMNCCFCGVVSSQAYGAGFISFNQNGTTNIQQCNISGNISQISNSLSQVGFGGMLSYLVKASCFINQSIIQQLNITGSAYCAGLLGIVDNTTLTVLNANISTNITSQNCTGGLMAFVQYSVFSLTNITVAGISLINGNSYTSAIIGLSIYSNVTASCIQSSSNVTTTLYGGGFTGYTSNGNFTIANSSFNGYVFGIAYLGSAFGYIGSSIISVSYCFFLGKINHQLLNNDCLYGQQYSTNTTQWNNQCGNISFCNFDMTGQCTTNNVTSPQCTITQFNEKYFTYANHSYDVWFAFSNNLSCSNLFLYNISINTDYKAFLAVSPYYSVSVLQNVVTTGYVALNTTAKQCLSYYESNALSSLIALASDITILNCTIWSFTTQYGNSFISTGGFIGIGYGNCSCNITNCSSNVSILGQAFGSSQIQGFLGEFSGGFAGQLQSNFTLSIVNCSYNGSVVGSEQVAGFVAISLGSNVAIINCTNTGYLQTDNRLQFSSNGAFIGVSSQQTSIVINESTFTGYVSCTSNCSDSIGSVSSSSISINNVNISSQVNFSVCNYGTYIGYVFSSTINIGYCSCNCSITSNNYLGGYIGFLLQTSVVVNNCSENGSIVGNNYVGGYIGATLNGSIVNLSNSTQTGVILGTINEAGGIFGFIQNSIISIQNTSSSAEINFQTFSQFCLYGQMQLSSIELLNNYCGSTVLCTASSFNFQTFAIQNMSVSAFFVYSASMQSTCNNIVMQNLNAQVSNSQYVSVGLFNASNSTTISNINISGQMNMNSTLLNNINSPIQVGFGTVLGFAQNLQLNNISISINSQIFGSFGTNIGGMIGYLYQNNSYSIYNCSVDALINSTSTTQNNAGGLIGGLFYQSYVTMYSIQLNGSINSSNCSSGLIGFLQNSQMDVWQSVLDIQCDGNVSCAGIVSSTIMTNISVVNLTVNGYIQGLSNLGSVAGQICFSNITNCNVSSQCNVVGLNQVGGFYGCINRSNISINFSYCTTIYNVNGSNNVGGLVGLVIASNATDSKQLTINHTSLSTQIDAIFNLQINSTVTGLSNTGGIIGSIQLGNISILNSTVSQFITSPQNGSQMVGQIFNCTASISNIFTNSVLNYYVASNINCTTGQKQISNTTIVNNICNTGFSAPSCTVNYFQEKYLTAASKIIISLFFAFENETCYNVTINNTMVYDDSYNLVQIGVYHQQSNLQNINILGNMTVSLMNQMPNAYNQSNQTSIGVLTSYIVNNTILQNCLITCNLSILSNTADISAGLIAGQLFTSSVQIKNISCFSYKIQSSVSYATTNSSISGGIGFALLGTNNSITNCSFNITITGSGTFGGVMGCTSNASTVFININVICQESQLRSANQTAGFLGLSILSTINISQLTVLCTQNCSNVCAGLQAQSNQSQFIINQSNVTLTTNATTNIGCAFALIYQSIANSSISFTYLLTKTQSNISQNMGSIAGYVYNATLSMTNNTVYSFIISKSVQQTTNLTVYISYLIGYVQNYSVINVSNTSIHGMINTVYIQERCYYGIKTQDVQINLENSSCVNINETYTLCNSSSLGTQYVQISGQTIAFFYGYVSQSYCTYYNVSAFSINDNTSSQIQFSTFYNVVNFTNIQVNMSIVAFHNVTTSTTDALAALQCQNLAFKIQNVSINSSWTVTWLQPNYALVSSLLYVVNGTVVTIDNMTIVQNQTMASQGVNLTGISSVLTNANISVNSLSITNSISTQSTWCPVSALFENVVKGTNLSTSNTSILVDIRSTVPTGILYYINSSSVQISNTTLSGQINGLENISSVTFSQYNNLTFANVTSNLSINAVNNISHFVCYSICDINITIYASLLNGSILANKYFTGFLFSTSQSHIYFNQTNSSIYANLLGNQNISGIISLVLNSSVTVVNCNFSSGQYSNLSLTKTSNMAASFSYIDNSSSVTINSTFILSNISNSISPGNCIYNASDSAYINVFNSSCTTYVACEYTKLNTLYMNVSNYTYEIHYAFATTPVCSSVFLNNTLLQSNSSHNINVGLFVNLKSISSVIFTGNIFFCYQQTKLGLAEIGLLYSIDQVNNTAQNISINLSFIVQYMSATNYLQTSYYGGICGILRCNPTLNNCTIYFEYINQYNTTSFLTSSPLAFVGAMFASSINSTNATIHTTNCTFNISHPLNQTNVNYLSQTALWCNITLDNCTVLCNSFQQLQQSLLLLNNVIVNYNWTQQVSSPVYPASNGFLIQQELFSSVKVVNCSINNVVYYANVSIAINVTSQVYNENSSALLFNNTTISVNYSINNQIALLITASWNSSINVYNLTIFGNTQSKQNNGVLFYNLTSVNIAMINVNLNFTLNCSYYQQFQFSNIIENSTLDSDQATAGYYSKLNDTGANCTVSYLQQKYLHINSTDYIEYQLPTDQNQCTNYSLVNITLYNMNNNVSLQMGLFDANLSLSNVNVSGNITITSNTSNCYIGSVYSLVSSNASVDNILINVNISYNINQTTSYIGLFAGSISNWTLVTNTVINGSLLNLDENISNISSSLFVNNVNSNLTAINLSISKQSVSVGYGHIALLAINISSGGLLTVENLSIGENVFPWWFGFTYLKCPKCNTTVYHMGTVIDVAGTLSVTNATIYIDQDTGDNTSWSYIAKTVTGTVTSQNVLIKTLVNESSYPDNCSGSGVIAGIGNQCT